LVSLGTSLGAPRRRVVTLDEEQQLLERLRRLVQPRGLARGERRQVFAADERDATRYEVAVAAILHKQIKVGSYSTKIIDTAYEQKVQNG
jgi:hypothetical protein